MKKIVDLNGWQRLWILICILYLFPVLYFTYSNPSLKIEPTEHRIRRLSQISKDEFVHREKIIGKSKEETRKLFDSLNAIGAFSDSEVAAYHSSFKQQLYYYLNNIFFYWFIPIIFVYIFGLLIKWVIRGFKISKSY